jgi:hypothetical protein
VCTFFAFWINFFQKRNVVNFERLFGKDITTKLDFVAHICGIVGLLGIIGSAYLGLFDASGVENPSLLTLLDLSIILQGFNTAMNSQLLGYKVTWTVVGIQLFLIAGIIRFYIVTIRKDNIYDAHIAVQIIYGGSQLWGFIVMVTIAATGGLYQYGETIMQNIPVITNLLPGAEFSLLPILSLFFGFLAIMTVLSIFIFKESENKSAKREVES